jgi:hypothetical protein
MIHLYKKVSTHNSNSTLGIQQYDGRFDSSMQAAIRHTFTWPRKCRNYLQERDEYSYSTEYDMPQDFLPSNASPGLSPGQLTPSMYEEPKLMPVYARSLSSSPPRGSLTPEQRELKRQQDSARRDSKTKMRNRSASNQSNHSNSYIVSQNGSPDPLPRTLPEYPNSLTPSPLLSQDSLQTSPALGSNSFFTPYSPPLNQGPLNNQSSTDMSAPVFPM